MDVGSLYRTPLKRGCIGSLKFGLARRARQLNRLACATEAPASLAVAILIRASVRVFISHAIPQRLRTCDPVDWLCCHQEDQRRQLRALSDPIRPGCQSAWAGA